MSQCLLSFKSYTYSHVEFLPFTGALLCRTFLPLALQAARCTAFLVDWETLSDAYIIYGAWLCHLERVYSAPEVGWPYHSAKMP